MAIDTERLLIKPAEAAERVSVRQFYDLMKVVPDIRAAVVEIPHMRGKFIRTDLLRRAIERLSPQVSLRTRWEPSTPWGALSRSFQEESSRCRRIVGTSCRLESFRYLAHLYATPTTWLTRPVTKMVSAPSGAACFLSCLRSSPGHMYGGWASTMARLLQSATSDGFRVVLIDSA